MARAFAKTFYDSKAWKDTRDYCLLRDHYSCVKCGNAAEEVHHKIWLTPENINDINITLNPDNLICLCHVCHTKEHSNKVDYPYEFDSNGMLIEKKF